VLYKRHHIERTFENACLFDTIQLTSAPEFAVLIIVLLIVVLFNSHSLLYNSHSLLVLYSSLLATSSLT